MNFTMNDILQRILLVEKSKVVYDPIKKIRDHIKKIRFCKLEQEYWNRQQEVTQQLDSAQVPIFKAIKDIKNKQNTVKKWIKIKGSYLFSGLEILDCCRIYFQNKQKFIFQIILWIDKFEFVFTFIKHFIQKRGLEFENRIEKLNFIFHGTIQLKGFVQYDLKGSWKKLKEFIFKFNFLIYIFNDTINSLKGSKKVVKSLIVKQVNTFFKWIRLFLELYFPLWIFLILSKNHFVILYLDCFYQKEFD